MKRGSKARAQCLHVRRRAIQRLGVGLPPSAQREIVSLIQAGNTRLLDRQSLRISVHRVEYEGLTFPVVYDRLRHTLVTVLPLDAYQGVAA